MTSAEGYARGYHDCPCRDCFEIAIGLQLDGDGIPLDPPEPSLCHACASAGCDCTGTKGCDVVDDGDDRDDDLDGDRAPDSFDVSDSDGSTS